MDPGAPKWTLEMLKWTMWVLKWTPGVLKWTLGGSQVDPGMLKWTLGMLKWTLEVFKWTQGPQNTGIGIQNRSQKCNSDALSDTQTKVIQIP